MECGLCTLRGEATKFKIGQMAVHILAQHQADPEYKEMIEMLQESKIVEDCAKCGHKKPTYFSLLGLGVAQGWYCALSFVLPWSVLP